MLLNIFLKYRQTIGQRITWPNCLEWENWESLAYGVLLKLSGSVGFRAYFVLNPFCKLLLTNSSGPRDQEIATDSPLPVHCEALHHSLSFSAFLVLGEIWLHELLSESPLGLGVYVFILFSHVEARFHMVQTEIPVPGSKEQNSSYLLITDI